MDERMVEAAQTGDINLLYELILNDPYVLDRIDPVPFSHTPLHVAASAGHIEFMMEMIKLKPTFARKLNQAGFSAMHLALQNDRTQAVLRLLSVKGREDLTPLHHVVQTGNVDLLVKLLKVCPEAIADVTVRDETVFHLAVKNDMFEAFQVLAEQSLVTTELSNRRLKNGEAYIDKGEVKREIPRVSLLLLLGQGF
ncbi:ankyrin repeat-containing protein BDA1-like [Gossypium arboreum]|uniref:ankyrin repeat-containing protein BDA1-like n=1 Tax=Gossypium arboreum TaxID=29729 RepID=UPI0022F1B718|nr:ankyrin repeat-containing protein BDA1-like [Gossypium arboreum]